MSKPTPAKKSQALDPHREREASNYENPIPSREYILEQLETYGSPLGYDQVAELLGLESENELIGIRRRLNAMERDGQLVRNRRGGFCLVNKKDLIAGRIIAHPDGFGFLKPDDGSSDLFLLPRQMRMVMHNDRAVVRVTGIDRRNRREGALVEVIERAHHTVVGRLKLEHGRGLVFPDNKRMTQEIFIPSGDEGDAKEGQIVVAEITEQPTRRSGPIGKIIEILGEHMAPGMETELAMRSHDIPVEWPEDVTQEIAGLNPEVEASSKQDREDIRQLPLVTIDGEDARDFDDAVYCEKTSKGWKLLVAIADVSHYVTKASALDKEGYERGNSVYFPDRVIPMLPEILSNGLCSLNPEVDRLCMVCEMFINQEGSIIRSRFFRGVMHSHARLTYTKVAKMLVDKEPALCETYAHVLPHLEELYALYDVLKVGRFKRGAIDFDTTETRIVFTDEMKVDKIVPVFRNDAHKLIEECMLAANVAAARFLKRKKLPALFRNHAGPSEDKLKSVRDFLGEMGLGLPGGKKPKAIDYANLLSSIKDRPDLHLIQTVLLRSLSQAVYGSSNEGHFGLSHPAYTHFTSPIRRYPDLIVHRAIKHLLDGGDAETFYPQLKLDSFGEHCSTTERRADDATRDAMDWLKCEYMQQHIGDELDGIITSVNGFGLFVELNDIYVDGLIHITALNNDYYHFDPVGHRLTGERSGKVYRLGDRLKVKVAQVDLDSRKIDFILPDAERIDEEEKPRKPKKKKRRKPRKKSSD